MSLPPWSRLPQKTNKKRSPAPPGRGSAGLRPPPQNPSPHPWGETHPASFRGNAHKSKPSPPFANFLKNFVNLVLTNRGRRSILTKSSARAAHDKRIWGYSSAGRALEWHSRGQRFDPAYLHQLLRRKQDCFRLSFCYFHNFLRIMYLLAHFGVKRKTHTKTHTRVEKR